MKISFEKFEIEIDEKWVTSFGTVLLQLNQQDIQADVESDKAKNGPMDRMLDVLVAMLPQLMEKWLAEPPPFPGFVRRPGHLRPVDLADIHHPGRVPTPTDIQEYIRKRQEAVAEGYAAGLGEPSKQLEPCAECDIDGPHTIHADRRVVRCMWCVAGIHLADRPPVGSLEYMDGPVANPFEPDPAS